MNRNRILAKNIRKIKSERNAVILAHLYQPPEVQDVADFVGDSLELSKHARDTKADVIVFAGVSFMAETAKILNPEKTVLIPDPYAGCPMAAMVTANDVLALKAAHPDAAVVCYVNSSIEVKAVSDICCTSANAVRVVRSLPERKIIFVPDQNLGHYVAKHCPDKEFFFSTGFCPTHHQVSLAQLHDAKNEHPNALVLVHPECKPEICDAANFIGSTSQMIEYARTSKAKSFIICTEMGIIHQMQKRSPFKEFFPVHAGMICPTMKRTSLVSIEASLEKNRFIIEIDKQILEKATSSVTRMLNLS